MMQLASKVPLQKLASAHTSKPAAEAAFLDASKVNFYAGLYTPLNGECRHLSGADRKMLVEKAKQGSFVSPFWMSQEFVRSEAGKQVREFVVPDKAANGHWFNSQETINYGGDLMALGPDKFSLFAVIHTLRCAVTGDSFMKKYGIDAAVAVARVVGSKVLPMLAAPPSTHLSDSIHHPHNSRWLYWAPYPMLAKHFGLPATALLPPVAIEGGVVDFTFAAPPEESTPYPTHPFLAQCLSDATLRCGSHSVRFACIAATEAASMCHSLTHRAKFAKNQHISHRQAVVARYNASRSSPSEWVGMPAEPRLASDVFGKFLKSDESARRQPAKKSSNSRCCDAGSSLFDIAMRRWCASTLTPSQGFDPVVATAMTTPAPFLSIPLWSIFGSKNQFAKLGSPVAEDDGFSNKIFTSQPPPTARPLQVLDANGSPSNFYCAASTTNIERLQFLLNNRF